MADRKKGSLLYRCAAFIVDKRKAFYLIYLLILVFSIVSSGWVKVNNTITDYLSETTETRQGLILMDREFVTYATAQIMVDNISLADAQRLQKKLSKTKGVKEIAFDDTKDHYADAAALFGVTFCGTMQDDSCEEALADIKEQLSDYDCYINAELKHTRSDRLAHEVSIVLPLSFLIILAVLLLSSHTYMEIPVLVLTFGAAAIWNKGSNFVFDEISYVSDSVAIVLQLALAVDYAIILCHRYTEEREKSDAREAVITALCKSIPEISGSCLTTLSGLAAMGFMRFEIGFDLSRVLIKAICISIVTVFTLMPGLLMSFSGLIDKTHHKSFVPHIPAWGNLVVRTRFVTPCIFGVVLVAAFFLSNRCPYVYSQNGISTITKNESQIATEMINDTFGNTNALAVVVPSGNYEKEQQLKRELEQFPQVESITALASIDAIDGYAVGDRLTPRQFAELTDMDVETVRLLYSAYAAEKKDYGKIVGGIDHYGIPLVEMFDFVYDMTREGYVSLDDETQDTLEQLHDKLAEGKQQLNGTHNTRLAMNLTLPEESPETFAFLNTVRKTAQNYYGDDVLLVGNTTADFDLSAAFSRDNIMITILSILFVLIVLFFTFQSAGLPLILILVIQGSIWINFAFSTVWNQPIFFMSYLVVTAIQMGANIDYAIVITNRYNEFRREMNKFEAIKKALDTAFPTVFTSGTILASAGFIIGSLSSDSSIFSLGIALGRGTLISIFLVMGILPQLLVLGDVIIEKTSFSLKEIRRERKETVNGGTAHEER